MRIIFVRHAQPNYTLDCLTPVGHLQAQAAAERLKDEPITKVYSSTYGRAIETAEYIAKAKGLSIADKFGFIRELRWRAPDDAPLPFDGHPWYTVDDMVKTSQTLVNPNWQTEGPFSKHPKLLSQVEPMGQAFDRLLADYGLDREGEYYRVRRCDESTIVMVSHAGASSMVLSHLFNLPFPFLCRAVAPAFTAITVVTFAGEQGQLTSPRFELVNDARHIADIDTEQFIETNP